MEPLVPAMVASKLAAKAVPLQMGNVVWSVTITVGLIVSFTGSPIVQVTV